MEEFYKKHKNNFIITVIAVCVVHFVKMTHYLPNWDNMYSMVMPDTSMVGFGRWLAGLISNMLTSQYDLQWVAGLLSAIFFTIP